MRGGTRAPGRRGVRRADGGAAAGCAANPRRDGGYVRGHGVRCCCCCCCRRVIVLTRPARCSARVCCDHPRFLLLEDIHLARKHSRVRGRKRTTTPWTRPARTRTADRRPRRGRSRSAPVCSRLPQPQPLARGRLAHRCLAAHLESAVAFRRLLLVDVRALAALAAPERVATGGPRAETHPPLPFTQLPTHPPPPSPLPTDLPPTPAGSSEGLE